MPWGLTDEGFIAKTADEIATSLKTAFSGKISSVLQYTARTFFGNLVNILADEQSQAWEAAQAAAHVIDPDNGTGPQIVVSARLRGVSRNGARKGLVPCTVNLDAAQSFAAGELVAHVEGDEENRWVNRDAVVSTSSGNYTNQIFESESAGEYSAPSGTLTVIAGAVSGWNSITNPTDATPGQDVESFEALAIRSDQSIAAGARCTAAGLQKALNADVEGIKFAVVYENSTNFTDADGVPPNTMWPVIWDGSPAEAADTDIAQAIYDNHPGGRLPFGTSSGAATDLNGNAHTIPFSRATEVPLFLDLTVTAPEGVDEDELKANLIAAIPEKAGNEANYFLLYAAALATEGVTAVTSLTLDTSGSPTGTETISAGRAQILTLDTGNINVA